MSGNNKVVASDHDAGRGTKRTYIAGYLISVTLTAVAFGLVKLHVDNHHSSPSDGILMLVLAALAVTQLFVQLVFFLHVGRESKPRWNAWALSFAVIVVTILVLGSLWIMSNLNYHMGPSPDKVNRYLNSQGDL